MKRETIIDMPVQKDNPLKEMFIQYVGEKLKPENNEVTPGMCVQVLKDEFSEFITLIEQENFIRGYKQCLLEVEQRSAELQK